MTSNAWPVARPSRSSSAAVARPGSSELAVMPGIESVFIQAIAGPRGFDAVALAKAEFDGWVGYYRREWRKVLAASVRMVRLGFGMPRSKTLMGAWFVLRANQLWAPYPQNDPVGARAYMRRFYCLV